jgi:hypothetical protein
MVKYKSFLSWNNSIVSVLYLICACWNILDSTNDDIAGNVIGDDDDEDRLVSSVKVPQEDEDFQGGYDATLFIICYPNLSSFSFEPVPLEAPEISCRLVLPKHKQFRTNWETMQHLISLVLYQLL